MQHPFINDLSDKSLEDLQTTISGLISKLNFASRTGNNALINQLNMALESYKSEYAKKMDNLIKKQNIQSKIKIEKDSNR
jgi:threonine aldolase